MQTQLMTWEVDKRYSEFHNLHQTLSKKRIVKNTGGIGSAGSGMIGGTGSASNTPNQLPKFPPKKLKSLKDQVI
jgi:PX domain